MSVLVMGTAGGELDRDVDQQVLLDSDNQSPAGAAQSSWAGTRSVADRLACLRKLE